MSLLDPNVATSIIGKSVAEVSNLEWIQQWSNVGFLKVVDGNGDGIVQINEFFMRGDIVVLATPEMAGLPYVISGLVAAGGLAAAMSTADGLLLAIANACHMISIIRSSTLKQTQNSLVVARIMLVVIGAAGAFVASMKLTGILVQLPGLFVSPIQVCSSRLSWCLVETSKPCWSYCWYDRALPLALGICIWFSSVEWLHGLALTVCVLV